MCQVRPRNFTVLSEGNSKGEPIADIVFVHGLGGHPARSWTSKPPEPPSRLQILNPSPNHPIEEPVFWPKDLLADDVPNARILTYGYESEPSQLNFLNPVNVNRASIYNHSENLLSDLVDKRVDSPNRPIIFVAHSLGGILVKDALKQSLDATFKPGLQAILPATAAIIFFGTPHRGSGWIPLAKKVTIFAMGRVENRVLDGLNVGSDTLQRLADAFAVMLKQDRFKVHSFVEGLGMSNISGFTGKVVEDYSSVIGEAAETVYTLFADHGSMCKFRGRDDDNYERVLAKIKAYLTDIVTKRVPSQLVNPGQRQLQGR